MKKTLVYYKKNPQQKRTKNQAKTITREEMYIHITDGVLDN